MAELHDLPVDDIFLSGMYHCIALRSTIASGRIVSISVPDLPETVRLIRADDIPGSPTIRVGQTEIPVLAGAQVRHVGESIALLCGPDELELQNLMSQIDVRYERTTPRNLTDDRDRQEIVYSRSVSIGNTQSAFDRAFQIVEGEYRLESDRLNPIHAVGALAIPETDGMRVMASTGWLYHMRSSVAAALGVSEDFVAGLATPSHRCGGGNIWYPSLIAAQAAVASYCTDAPVRMILNPSERSQLLARRPGCIIQHKTALSRSGKIIGMEIEIAAEDGAYPSFPRERLDRLCLAAAGYYAYRSIKIDGRLVASNLPPADTGNGMGTAESLFAMEIHATRLAELSKEDPITWRLTNILPERNSTVTRVRAGSTPQRKLLERVLTASDFARKYSANELRKNRQDGSAAGMLRGIGVASGYVGSGFMSEDGPDTASVSLELDSEGTLHIKSSCSVEPEVSRVLYAPAAAEILGLEAEAIEIEPPHSDTVPDSGPSVMSRNVTIVRRLVENCANSIQKRRFRVPLPLEVSRQRRTGRKWDVETFRGTPFSLLSWASCVVEIELDVVSLEIGLRGIWLSASVGSVVDTSHLRASLQSEIIDAYELCTGNGSAMPGGTIDGGRRLHIDILPANAARTGPADGLASGTFAPAFVSAVSQATGFYFDSQPLTRSLILQYAGDR